MVGRGAELETLDGLLRAAGADGDSAVVAIAGEPGIGKTTLLAEAKRRASRRGFRTLSGRAVEVERDLPFSLFVDALDEALGADRQWDSIAKPELALLATVFPSLAGYGRPNGGLPPDERHLLLVAIRKVLGLLGAERPLTLTLDDLQWADPASIDLLCQIVQRGIGAPTLLLLASRPAQSPPRLLSAIDEAEREGRLQRLSLAPLSAEQAEELFGSDLSAEARASIYRASGGNPFYLEQLITAARRGLQSRPAAAPSEADRSPDAVRSAINQELELFSGAARALAAGASLLGEPFDPQLAADTAAISAAELPEALDQLCDLDLIRPAGSAKRFSFRHPIVRQAVFESAGAGWRLAAHARAASILETQGAPASARAAHIEDSAQPGDEAAAAVLAQAGQETAVRAPASAARWFEGALRLTPERGDNLELRLGLLLQRAAALGSAGQVEESRAALGEFLTLAPADPSDLRHQATIFAATLDEVLGHHEVGRALLLAELSRLADQEGPAAADLKRELAFTYFLDPDWEAMGDWARKALAADCEGMVRVGSLSALALAQFARGELEFVRHSVPEAAALFDSLGDAEVAAHHPGVVIWLGWAEVCAERFDDAIRHSERVIALMLAGGQRHLTVGLMLVQGMALVLKGDQERLSATAEAATDAALLSSSDLFLSWAMVLRSHASIEAGDLYAAVRYGELGVGAGAASKSPQGSIARIPLAAALLLIGEAERCRELLIGANGAPEPPSFPMAVAGFYELLTRTEIERGDLTAAEEFANLAESTAKRLGLNLPLAQAHRARALVLLERGEARAASAEAQAATEAAEKAGAAVEAGLSSTLVGTALAAAGERAAAISTLEGSYATLLDHGALHFSHLAARELRALGQPVAEPHAGDTPLASELGLTERELEVMEAIAEGKTNRQIADLLVLSVRTVDRHVSRIFAKLGVHSRAAASSVFERARARHASITLL